MKIIISANNCDKSVIDKLLAHIECFGDCHTINKNTITITDLDQCEADAWCETLKYSYKCVQYEAEEE